MNRHPSGEHFHKLRDPLGARFRPFGIVHPVDDRVAIGAIQGLEETLGGFVRRKCSREVLRNLRCPLRGICGLPSPIRFRRLNLSKAGGLKAPLHQESIRSLTVLRGPAASRTARSHADKKILVVKPVELPVDPTPTKRHFDRVPLVDRRLNRAGLRELEPKSLRRPRLARQVCFEILRSLER